MSKKKTRNRERLSDYADVPDYRDPNVGRNLSYTEKRNSDYKHGPAMAKARRKFDEEERKALESRDIWEKILTTPLGKVGNAMPNRRN